MKKTTLFQIIIVICLFLIPFQWFKPGEMDLGGDSTRLYFYDPINYLVNHALFTISSSGFGNENISVYIIPYVLLLYAAKLVVHSPTILIASSYGLKIAFGYLFSYLFVQRIVRLSNPRVPELDTVLSAALAGILYVFAPSAIRGWDNVILTHDQMFLNPLMAYLLLQFLTSKKWIYGIMMLIVTIIFPSNFSYGGAPPFFAFYPLFLLFVGVFITFILNRKIPFIKVALLVFAFVGLHAYHLIPQIIQIMDPQSSSYQTIFEDQGKLQRGLTTFTSLSHNIHLSKSFFFLPQLMDFNPHVVVTVVLFPLIIVVALLMTRNKTLLLSALLWLIMMYLVTANISTLFFKLYQQFFKYIPGFAMFRTYFGQFGYAYLFYYVVTFGIALFVIVQRVNSIKAKSAIYILLFIFLMIQAVPFISGKIVNPLVGGANNVYFYQKIEQPFEETMQYVRSLEPEWKVLTLPLSDPGYQIIAGGEGVYQGPSTVAYLGGKQDFAGLFEMDTYQEVFGKAVTENNTCKILLVLSRLNVKYIFYNQDSRVYDSSFPISPYTEARKFMPKTQEEYKTFISKLPVTLIYENYPYNIYELDGQYLTPRIHTSSHLNYRSKPEESTTDPVDCIRTLSHINTDSNLPEISSNFSSATLTAKPYDFYLDKSLIPLNYLGHVVLTQKPGTPTYLLAQLKERYSLARIISPSAKFDHHLFYSHKRIAELEKYGSQLSIIHWKELFDSRKEHLERAGHILQNQFDDSLYYYNIAKMKYVLESQNAFLQYFISSSSLLPEEKDELQQTREQNYGQIKVTLGNQAILKPHIGYKIPSVPISGTYSVALSVNERLLENSNNTSLIYRRRDNSDEEAKYIESSDSLTDTYSPIYLNKNNGEQTIYLTKPSLSFKPQWFTSGSIVSSENNTEFLSGIDNESKSATFVLPILYPKHANAYYLSMPGESSGTYFLDLFDTKKLDETSAVQYVKRDITFVKLLGTIDDSLHETLIKKDTDTALLKLSTRDIQARFSSGDMQHAIFTLEPFYLTFTQETTSLTEPIIEFSLINPTKYKIKVSNVQGPYVLAFLQAYNSKWKLYDSDKVREKSHAYPNKLLFWMGSLIRKSEFLGISFADNSVFETWKKPMIAENTHFKANGYGNAWIVLPDMLDGKTEYELILELTTQQYFYIGLLIGIWTAVLIIVLSFSRILLNVLKNRKHR